MATRRTQAQLIRAQAGSAAPLVHASVGPNAQLVSADARIVNGSAPSGNGRRYRGTTFSEPTSPGGFKKKENPNAPANTAGNNFRLFKNRKGNWELRAGDGKTILRRGNARELEAIIQRGGAGGTLNDHDLAVYRQSTGWKSEEQKANDIRQEKRQQELDDAKAAEERKIAAEKRAAAEWDRRTEKEHEHDDQERRMVENRKRWAEQEQMDATNKALGLPEGVTTTSAMQRGLLDGTHRWNAEKGVIEENPDYTPDWKKREDYENEQWNIRNNIPANVRVSDADKAAIKYGKRVWKIDPDDEKELEWKRKALAASIAKGDVEKGSADEQKALADIAEFEKNARYGVFDNPNAPTAAQIRAEAEDNDGIYIDRTTGQPMLLPGWAQSQREDPAVARQEKQRAALEAEQRKYILDNIGRAYKDYNAWDSTTVDDATGKPIPRPYADANGAFDVTAIVKDARNNWNAVMNPTPAPEQEINPQDGSKQSVDSDLDKYLKGN